MRNMLALLAALALIALVLACNPLVATYEDGSGVITFCLPGHDCQEG